MNRKFTAIVILALLLALSACGDYKPCEVLATRICNECASVADHWQAACLCVENKTLKEQGYKCLEPNDEDEIRCHSNLENWDEDTCALLN